MSAQQSAQCAACCQQAGGERPKLCISPPGNLWPSRCTSVQCCLVKRRAAVIGLREGSQDCWQGAVLRAVLSTFTSAHHRCCALDRSLLLHAARGDRGPMIGQSYLMLRGLFRYSQLQRSCDVPA